MRNKKRYKKHKILKITHIKYMLIVLFVSALFMPGMPKLTNDGDNFFMVNVNGIYVGSVFSEEEARKMLLDTRRKIAAEQDGLAFMKSDMTLVSDEIFWGAVDNKEEVQEKMEEVIRASLWDSLQPSCTLKVNEYMVNLADMEEAGELLQAAIEKYDSSGDFRVELLHDENREFSIMTARVAKEENTSEEENVPTLLMGGVDEMLSRPLEENGEEQELAFEDYTYGVQEMHFSEKIEMVDSYLPQSRLTPLATAIEEVIKEQETAAEYTVVSGDTLSEIAIRVGIPMDRIVEMNSELLESENSPLHVGDKLIITVPEPELSVTRTEQSYYEESYDADIVYIENDSWYTYESKVHQQPSAGFRKAVASEYYINDKLVDRQILKEEVVLEAVPKIVERGTKVPPTYMKPISGGRQTSGFGKRKAPTKGASTYHKGVDWAVPIGTAVYASCGGTVEKAGWGSGYGYVVYINHEDGRQTRYGHCSKVLVKPGQKVKQGEKIALSGNTGVTSGPHVHFEILINGSQVDPLKYLN